MIKTDHRKPINFVGLCFLDDQGDDYRTGQIVAQISDGHYLAEFDGPPDMPPPPMEVLSVADFNQVCDSCGTRHWQFFADAEARQRWIDWVNTPDPIPTRSPSIGWDFCDLGNSALPDREELCSLK